MKTEANLESLGFFVEWNVNDDRGPSDKRLPFLCHSAASHEVPIVSQFLLRADIGTFWACGNVPQFVRRVICHPYMRRDVWLASSRLQFVAESNKSIFDIDVSRAKPKREERRQGNSEQNEPEAKLKSSAIHVTDLHVPACVGQLLLCGAICTALRRIVPSAQDLQHLKGQDRPGAPSRQSEVGF